MATTDTTVMLVQDPAIDMATQELQTITEQITKQKILLESAQHIIESSKKTFQQIQIKITQAGLETKTSITDNMLQICYCELVQPQEKKAKMLEYLTTSSK